MNNFVKLIFITISLVSLFGCASFNTPFIDTDETTQLTFGMTKSEVIKSIGNPLYVESGGKGNVIWVYEVRNIEVQSKPDIIPVIQSGGPNKSHRNFRHGKPDHRLTLTFEDDKLIDWGPIAESDD